MLQEAGHIKNTVVLIFWHIQCLHLMTSEVAWILVYLGTQVHLPSHYLSISYDYCRRCSSKYVFLKISQTLQQNTSVEVSF